eukprot:c20205_g1_i4.p1 GENE.c20205_g1_i4~~c20205_g1_i4.p1  ORF type:complete len:1220 (+),score=639.22 c20205_g1_i4:36-3662(+)
MSETVLHPKSLPDRYFYSPLQKERLKFQPPLPKILRNSPTNIVIHEKEALAAQSDSEKIQELFPKTFGQPRVEFYEGDNKVVNSQKPLRIGVVLSGGQAPGGHNVIAGIFDGAKLVHPDSVLFGFLDGPKGIFTGTYAEITPKFMDAYRNTGGFDMIRSGRDKIETEEHYKNSQLVCEALDLDGLVVIGGDDSNTNAAVLAEYFAANNCKTKICGCPKTIDGDLKNIYIPISFGFDTACHVFSEEIGNICLDTLATQKYWHFVRLMGRSASSIALECALQTRPNVCLIGEEVKEKKLGLADISKSLADLVVKRSGLGKSHGVVLLPEGLIEFMPEFMLLISEINDLLASGTPAVADSILAALSAENAKVFSYLPSNIQKQLVLDRDPHGNVNVSQIETEKLLASTVSNELQKMGFKGKFNPQFNFCGYEGRSALPSPFDTTYTYALGRTAALLVANGRTSLMASVRDLEKPVEEWTCGGVPITMMCCIEKRKGKFKPVIQKALVELDGERAQPFKAFASRREFWAETDCYRCIGPIQFDSEVRLCQTLHYELCGIDDDETEGINLKNKIEALTQKCGQFYFHPQSIESLSETCQARLTAKIPLPNILSLEHTGVRIGEQTQALRARDRKLVKTLFPHTYNRPLIELASQGDPHFVPTPKNEIRVGVVLCGRQTPGTHNVVCGLHDTLKRLNEKSHLFGFLMGSKGLFSESYVELTEANLANYRNQGGVHLLGRTADHIRAKSEIEATLKSCENLNLDALVLIGAARTHTDAAYLSEYFATHNSKTAVIACPVGIGGEMSRGTFVQTTVGFDTHCRTTAEMVGNTQTDGASNRKYYYFLRLTAGGLLSSHSALEVALQTHPTMTILTEEVGEQHKSLRNIVSDIADVVSARALHGKNYGTILISEGLLGTIPEIASLLDELDSVLPALGEKDRHAEKVKPLLTPWAASLLNALPDFAQEQLLLERQSDGRIDLGKVDTERLLAHLVEEELERRKKLSAFKGKFSAITSIRSSQSRSSVPTNFDCELGYAVGASAAVLSAHHLNGYFVSITSLHRNVSDWKIAGAPISCLLVVDGSEFLEDGSSLRPIVAPTNVDFGSPAYLKFAEESQKWAIEDCDQNPGPAQFSGSTVDNRAITIDLSQNNYLSDLGQLWHRIEAVKLLCRPGCDRGVVHVASKMLDTLQDALSLGSHEGGSASLAKRLQHHTTSGEK